MIIGRWADLLRDLMRMRASSQAGMVEDGQIDGNEQTSETAYTDRPSPRPLTVAQVTHRACTMRGLPHRLYW